MILAAWRRVGRPAARTRPASLKPAGGTAHAGKRVREREAPVLPDDEHAVAARDEFPDDGRSGQFPGDEQPA